MEPVFIFNCELHKIRISEMIPIRFWSGYCFLWLSATGTVKSGNLVSFFAQNIFFSQNIHTRWFFLEQSFLNSEPRWWAFLLYLSPLSFFVNCHLTKFLSNEDLHISYIPEQNLFHLAGTWCCRCTCIYCTSENRSKYAANQASSFQHFWCK